MIFVFGSNLAGRHGKGAAKYALEKCGAVYGVGEGLMGQSYAIPTKDHNLKSLPLMEIESRIDTFISVAKNNPDLKFYVTQVGCGLAGYKPTQIAHFFWDAPPNCFLPYEFEKHLHECYINGSYADNLGRRIAANQAKRLEVQGRPKL